MTNLVIVGQAPSKTADAKRPLSADTGSGKLMMKMLGIGVAEYMGVERLNLLPRWPGKAGKKGDAFDAKIAAVAAGSIIVRAQKTHFVLLGRGVAKAFGVDAGFCRTKTSKMSVGARRIRFLILPHPSGVNRWWNDKANKALAQRSLRRFAKQAAEVDRLRQYDDAQGVCVKVVTTASTSPNVFVLANGPRQVAGSVIATYDALPEHQDVVIALKPEAKWTGGASFDPSNAYQRTRTARYKKGQTEDGKRQVDEHRRQLYFFERWLD